MQRFLQDVLFWGLTVAPWLNIILVSRLAWLGRPFLAALLILFVGIGAWLMMGLLQWLFGAVFFSPGWAVFGWMIQTLWAMGIALCVLLFVAFVRHNEQKNG